MSARERNSETAAVGVVTRSKRNASSSRVGRTTRQSTRGSPSLLDADTVQRLEVLEEPIVDLSVAEPVDLSVSIIDLTCDADDAESSDVVYIAGEATPLQELTPVTLVSRARASGDGNNIDTVIDVVCDYGNDAGASTPSSSSILHPVDQTPPTTIACAVCLESLSRLSAAKKQILSTMCGHVFCEPCMKGILDKFRKCPMCRKKLTQKQVHPLYL